MRAVAPFGGVFLNALQESTPDTCALPALRASPVAVKAFLVYEDGLAQPRARPKHRFWRLQQPKDAVHPHNNQMMSLSAAMQRTVL